MPRLSPQLQASRLELDFRILSRMNSATFRAEAYASPADARLLKRPIVALGDAKNARAWVLVFHLRSLTGRGHYGSHFEILVDPLAGGDYPFTAPVCEAVTLRAPSKAWHHRIHPANGKVCLGPIWDTHAPQITLGHLALQIAKLLNFDEPTAGDKGFNPEAWTWWQETLKGRPIDPGAVYPVYPEESELVDGPPKFRPLGPTAGRSPASVFRPLSGT